MLGPTALLISLSLALMDAACILAAYGLTIWYTVKPGAFYLDHFLYHSPYVIAIMLVWFLAASGQRLYVSHRNDALVPLLFLITKSISFSVLFSVFLVALFRPELVSRELVIPFALSMLTGVLIVRLVVRLGVWDLRRRGYNHQRVLLIGANETTKRVLDTVLSHENYGIGLAGYLEDDEKRQEVLADYDIAYRGKIEALEALLVDDVIDTVYITLPLRSSYERIRSIAYLCEGVGVPVRLVADLFPLQIASSELTRLGSLLFVSFSTLPEKKTLFAVKRIVDVLVAGLLLLVMTPILALIAFLLRLSQGAPILVSERRIGWNETPFNMLRFRTQVERDPDSAYPKRGRIGDILYRQGLDELPMLWNVFRGQLSFSSPRPPLALPDELRDSDESKEVLSPPAAQKLGEKLGREQVYMPILLVMLDFVCISATFTWAVWETLPRDPLQRAYLESFLHLLPYALIFMGVWASEVLDQRHLRTRRSEDASDYVATVVKAVCDGMMISVFMMALFSDEGIRQQFLMSFCLGTVASLIALRLIVRAVLGIIRKNGLNVERVVLIGCNERAANLVKVIQAHAMYGLTIVGYIDDNRSMACHLEDLGLKHLGTFDDTDRILREERIQEVYITLPVRSFYETVQEIATLCEPRRVPVRLLADLFPLRIARGRLLQMEDIPLLSLTTIPEAQFRVALKRLFDFLVSSTLIALLSPAFLLMAIIIKLDSPGPVFFYQERVGKNQRRFKMIKYRTMVVNAEELRKELEEQNEADGPVFKIRNDPRITRHGRWMRKFSVDEFPQLLNVWKGEMSLVGPRPPIPSEVEQYSWDQRRRLSVSPGMTGLWQVSGRSDVDFESWVGLDLKYIDNWSLMQDFSILLRTFGAVVKGRGAA